MRNRNVEPKRKKKMVNILENHEERRRKVREGNIFLTHQ